MVEVLQILAPVDPEMMRVDRHAVQRYRSWVPVGQAEHGVDATAPDARDGVRGP